MLIAVTLPCWHTEPVRYKRNLESIERQKLFAPLDVAWPYQVRDPAASGSRRAPDSTAAQLMATTTSPDLSSRHRDGVGTPRPGEHVMPVAAGPSVEAGGDFVIGSIRRHKLLVALMGMILAVAGVGVGLARKPTYTASATLQVGTVNLNSPGLYGYLQSASGLAGVFSQSITAAPVLEQIDAKLAVSPRDAVQRLSAAPLPLSPSFRIIATGSSSASAVKLANVASEAVIADVARSATATSPSTEHMLSQYQHAAQGVQKSAAATAALAKRKHQFGVGEDPALIRAQGELEAARLHLNALGAAYQSVLVSAGASPSSGLVSLVAGAVTATSDQRSKIELLGFIGLLAGLVVGSAAAVMVEQRRSSRLSE